jgi:hypothetical protein
VITRKTRKPVVSSSCLENDGRDTIGPSARGTQRQAGHGGASPSASPSHRVPTGPVAFLRLTRPVGLTPKLGIALEFNHAPPQQFPHGILARAQAPLSTKFLDGRQFLGSRHAVARHSASAGRPISVLTAAKGRGAFHLYRLTDVYRSSGTCSRPQNRNLLELSDHFASAVGCPVGAANSGCF